MRLYLISLLLVSFYFLRLGLFCLYRLIAKHCLNPSPISEQRTLNFHHHRYNCLCSIGVSDCIRLKLISDISNNIAFQIYFEMTL